MLLLRGRSRVVLRLLLVRRLLLLWMLRLLLLRMLLLRWGPRPLRLGWARLPRMLRGLRMLRLVLLLVVPRTIRRLLVGLLAVRVLLRVRIAPSPAGARGLHDGASMPDTRPDSILLA
ncbi:hypothetical protein EBO15_29375 [Actinomadura harenae]|uniref:Uncharacterized protein n=1 Tax=Actinomadura harenae TaxID=2483351 RepID=A0A3M2LQG6_9ACTN|nr:hypothetical protein EBO15_29375 [Actinomadura harenae]